LEEALDPNVRIPVGQAVAGRIAVSGQPLIVDDLTKTEVISPAVRERLKSLVGVPLRIGDRLVGVVHAGSDTHRHFTDADARLLSLIADRIAVPIENVLGFTTRNAPHAVRQRRRRNSCRSRSKPVTWAHGSIPFARGA
jgi:GAF domain-containing protein